jgi:site-specific DNA-methyltransferase (adenine-specific)
MSHSSIIVGDCLEELAALPSQSVDIILTDPPYTLPDHQLQVGPGLRPRSFGEFGAYQHFFRRFVREATRVLKRSGDLVVFCDETTYAAMYPILYEAFCATKLLVWDKRRIGLGGVWRRQFELVAHSYLTPKRARSRDGDILAAAPVRAKLHPSQKPVDLLERLLAKLAPPHAAVLDPFAGSGSTLVAAERLGMDAVGIEISPDYALVAKTRLADLAAAQKGEARRDTGRDA